MVTIFSTPKPFRGHIDIIQRNALKSWTLLHPDVEVILFGDDQGAPEVAIEFGLRHEPFVERHESGMKYGEKEICSLYGPEEIRNIATELRGSEIIVIARKKE